MAWPITVGGTIDVDDIATPCERRTEVLGGSALYFTLAAARFAPVYVLARIGRDVAPAVQRLLEHPRVDATGLAVTNQPSRRWQAVHDFETWTTVSEATGEDDSWHPRLSPAAAAAPVLFLGSIRPRVQLEIAQASSALLVGADTMAAYIEDDRERVLEVAERADVLFLNRGELAQLVPHASDWRSAARSFLGRGRARAVVVKAGPSGAACVTSRSTVERAAEPVARVADPTGAGDALAGGFLGSCARAERPDEEYFSIALEHGLRCAAAAIRAFGTEGLGD